MINLKELRSNSKISQQKLADSLGVSRSTVAMWETGASQPDNNMLLSIADYFDVTTDYLLGNDTKKEPFDVTKDPNYIEINKSRLKRIPILGTISAGLPLYADEHIEGYTFTDLNGGAEYFALRVRGDSMNAARICDGDLVIVRRQPTVENGEIAVVLVDKENATVKRFNQNGNIVILSPQSSNPAHQIQQYDISQTKIEVLGKVVRVEINF